MAFVAAPGAAFVQIGELVKVVFADKKEYLFKVTDIDHDRRLIRGIYEVDGSESPPLDGACARNAAHHHNPHGGEGRPWEACRTTTITPRPPPPPRPP